MRRRDFIKVAGSVASWPLKALGITVPQSLLSRADEVIE
jgi:hypothetical protein